MQAIQITLTLKQLFIAEHGIRERLKRPGISDRDKEEEAKALDTVNKGIRELTRKN
jgi:hypothetical protein